MTFRDELHALGGLRNRIPEKWEVDARLSACRGCEHFNEHDGERDRMPTCAMCKSCSTKIVRFMSPHWRCPLGKWDAELRPKISVCINTHNEGARVRATVAALRENLADWPHEIIVVADEVTDGGCDDLGSDVTVIRNKERRGCARCKLQAIRAATGDVIVFLDAHHSVIAGRISDMAMRAWQEEAIFTPVVRNIKYDAQWNPVPANTHNQAPCDSGMRFEKQQYEVRPNAWVRENHLQEIRMVGVGFAISRRTLARIGGLNAYRGIHGSQERGIALRAFMAQVPVKLFSDLVLGHEFRAGKPRPKGYKRYSVKDQSRNFWHAYFVVAGDEAFEKLKPILRHKAKGGQNIVTRPDVIAERERFQRECRKRSDDELLELLGLAPTKSVLESSSLQPPVSSQPKIDIRIAYEPGAKIGQDYNRIMRETAHEWVLFLDHDVLLLHPSWYEVCQRAIREHPDAGLLTCFTNNIACKHQKDPGAPRGHDVAHHRARARVLWEEHGYACTENRRWLIGGFFMLTSKAAWRKADGFPEDGFFGVDNEYHHRIMKAGFKCYRMDGLYGYHLRDRQGGNWIKGVDTSATLARNRTPLEMRRSTAPPTHTPTRKCIYTVVTGGYDTLPRHHDAAGWEFIAFTDEPGLQSDQWEVRVFDAEGLDLVRASRLPKILAHRFLADYDYSLYLDANFRLRRNPSAGIERAGWPDFASVKHPFRHCVYDELRVIGKLGKAPKAAAAAQAARYRAEGVPERRGLYENGVLMRRHNTPDVKAICEAWWNEYVKSETRRDQPALAVVLWKLGRSIETISATERTRWMTLKPHRPLQAVAIGV